MKIAMCHENMTLKCWFQQWKHMEGKNKSSWWGWVRMLSHYEVTSQLYSSRDHKTVILSEFRTQSTTVIGGCSSSNWIVIVTVG